MLRTALKPRWLALLLVMLVAASGMAALGTWQLDRARENAVDEQTLTAPPTPIEQVLQPRRTFPKGAIGARVVVQGRWDDARRLLVADREVDGRVGYWVLAPLVRDDGTAVPVVRGWVPDPGDPAVGAATEGPVEVIGLLQPSEPPQDRAPGEPSGLPPGQLRFVSMPDLVNSWTTYPLVTGFVVQQEQRPAADPAPRVVPPPVAAPGYDWRNVSYAVQWWVFAGFGLFLWYRLVRDDHRGLLAGSVPT